MRSVDYEAIGVRPFINCCGTRTIHGGTLMGSAAKEAMMAASNGFVNMDELMEGVGKRLSELTGAEWGIVTSGAAAALCHATAACVAGADPEVMLRLPDTRGLEDRVVMLKGGRFTYDHAIRTAGVTVVEVEDREALAAALDDRTAMVALLGTYEPVAAVRLEEIVALTGPRDIPVLVDAASEHLQRPVPYLARGATMVSYSGGKVLRGPQPTGLLLGKEKWVRAAWANAAPHHALGRAMKVGKEEVMGVLAAVEFWVEGRDHTAEQDGWRSALETISKGVRQAATVTTEVLEPDDPSAGVPRMEIRWDGQRVGVTGLELRQRLLEGTPRIMLDDRGATEGSVFILPFSLQPGDAETVGDQIREVLSSAVERSSLEDAPPVSVAGTWHVSLSFTVGAASHQVSIAQKGKTLSGRHRTRYHENPISGAVRGNEVEFASLHRYEGTHLAYRFVGRLVGVEMRGSVELGSSGQSAPGPLNQREYGTAEWTAVREDRS